MICPRPLGDTAHNPSQHEHGHTGSHTHTHMCTCAHMLTHAYTHTQSYHDNSGELYMDCLI